MANTKKWLWAYLPVFIICLALNIWGMYFEMFLKNNVAVVTGYVGDATYSDETKYFMNVEYFSNENANGIENFGFWFNYYTDTEIPDKKEDGSYGSKYMYSSGVQFANGYQYGASVNTDYFTYSYAGYAMQNCVYYNADTNLSFYATNSLENQNKWVYDIGGKLFVIKEKGEVKEFNTLWVSRGTKYDTSMLLKDIYQIVKGLPEGEHVVKMDLSKFYNVYPYNEETRQFDLSQNVIEEQFVFVDVYINKTNNGLVAAKQSNFKLYMNNRNWTLYGDEVNDSYWQANAEYNLTLSDFTFVYENGGYYLKLQAGCINYLLEFKNLRILVNIDIDNIYLGNEKLKIEGFSHDAFGKLKIDKVTLKSNETRSFIVYDKALNIEVPDNISVEIREVV